ncbi:MAG: cytochrome-c peroxidase [Bacteroidetes bacterium]|nr:cytochrome-c peroxidase [Bacteroidota bacterium]
MKKELLSYFFFLLLIFFFACKEDDSEPQPVVTHPTPYNITIPKYFPTLLNIPADNPMTVEGVKLGRYLFYDGRLSGRTQADSLMSCATCHVQANAFEVGMNNPKYPNGKTYGLTGIPTPHFMMPMENLAFNNNGYLWNGLINQNNTNLGSVAYGVPALQQYHFKNIESLVWMAIAAPHEINGSIDRTVQTIASVPMYPPMFKAAFGTEEINYDRISKAIAQFVRIIISSNSKFDKYLRGETNLTADEIQGYVLFTTENGADCFHCHGGSGNPMFTTNLFYNNGKDSIFSDPKDRFSVTQNNVDKGAYKAPSLRNVMLTAPYMHDGRFKTIDQVIDFYSEGVIMSPYTNPLMHQAINGGVQLTPTEKLQLKAFLNTLTDMYFVTDVRYSKPADLK